jgi:hypothetical protein
MKGLLIASVVILMVAPAFADDSGYHEVYEWGYDGAQAWRINPEQHAELFAEGSEHNQYRWESNPAATICQMPYYPPEPEPPHQKVVTDQACLFPWIDFNVYEKNIHWDIFKPGIYMGKSFQVWMRANTPVQVLFGCGTILAPVSFNKADKEIVWDEFTYERCLTDKIRIKSILGIKDNPGTPPDELQEYLYWYPRLGDRPDPHRITGAEMEMIPPFGNVAWRHAPDLNGTIWTIPDSEELHVGWWYQFFEALVVEACDSEGDYYKEIVMTVCPDP